MATLEGWAIETDYLFLDHVPGGADHTYVVSSEGTRFECGGRNQGGRLIVSGQGSHKLAKALSRNNYGGMVYGLTGVCHQEANRVLYPCGRNVHRAKGAGWSYTVYGIYGKPHEAWLAWKTECEIETGTIPGPYGIPIPYGIPPILGIATPRWPHFATNPTLNLVDVASANDLVLPVGLDPAVLEFADSEWADKEMFTVTLLMEAVGAAPEAIQNAELETFLKIRSDGRISDAQIMSVFRIRDEFDQQRRRLVAALTNGEHTSHDFIRNHVNQMAAEFTAIERVLGPRLYGDIYDLPPDHSPAILNPRAFGRSE
ncbi:hypothetical protein BH11PLA2_BH11PLA2_22520 [soil metagenome]